MRRPMLATGILVTATTLAGCAPGATDASTTSTPTPTTTAVSTSEATGTATTAPPALSREDAAQRYLDIVRPYNEALEELEDAYNSGQPLPTLTALAAEVADELETEMTELRATAWPAEVRTHVDELVAVSATALEHWRQAAEAQTPEELLQDVRAAGEFDATDAASAIRELLDLEEYDERDY